MVTMSVFARLVCATCRAARITGGGSCSPYSLLRVRSCFRPVLLRKLMLPKSPS